MQTTELQPPGFETRPGFSRGPEAFSQLAQPGYFLARENMVTTTPMPMAKPRPSVYNSDIVLPPKTHHLCLTVICEITLCPVSAKYRVCGSRDRHNGIYSPHNILSYRLGLVPPTKKAEATGHPGTVEVQETAYPDSAHQQLPAPPALPHSLAEWFHFSP